MPFSLDETLEYIATELAFGHGGFITTPQLSEDYLKVALLEQRHVLTTQRLYAHAEVVRILYNDQGQEIEVSEYIKRHPITFSDIYHEDFMSQVRVEYNNGVIVCVNRHPTREWYVGLGDAGGWFNFHATINGKDSLAIGNFSRTDYQLPVKYGWVVYSPNASTSEISPKQFQFTLSQNYPNPFNSTTTIEFTVPKHTHVTIKVFNLLGQTVTTLFNKFLSEGTYTTILDTSALASGVYIYRIKADGFVESKKLLLIR